MSVHINLYVRRWVPISGRIYGRRWAEWSQNTGLDVKGSVRTSRRTCTRRVRQVLWWSVLRPLPWFGNMVLSPLSTPGFLATDASEKCIVTYNAVQADGYKRWVKPTIMAVGTETLTITSDPLCIALRPVKPLSATTPCSRVCWMNVC